MAIIGRHYLFSRQFFKKFANRADGIVVANDNGIDLLFFHGNQNLPKKSQNPFFHAYHAFPARRRSIVGAVVNGIQIGVFKFVFWLAFSFQFSVVAFDQSLVSVDFYFGMEFQNMFQGLPSSFQRGNKGNINILFFQFLRVRLGLLVAELRENRIAPPAENPMIIVVSFSMSKDI